MSRRVRPLVAADLASLPDGCRRCPLGDRPTDAGAAWVRGALNRYGFFGLGAFEDDDVLGYLLLAPASHVPRVHPLSGRAAPTSAVLLRAHLAVDDPRDALGRHLTSAAAARLRAVPSVRRLEAMPALDEPTCVTPERAWLAALGFAPTGEGRTMALDLARTVSWRHGVAAVRRRLGALAPSPHIAGPEPSARCR